MFGNDNEFDRLIEKVFFDNYREGMTEFEFTFEDIEKAANDLGIVLPENFEDVLLSFENYGSSPREHERLQSESHQSLTRNSPNFFRPLRGAVS